MEGLVDRSLTWLTGSSVIKVYILSQRLAVLAALHSNGVGRDRYRIETVHSTFVAQNPVEFRCCGRSRVWRPRHVKAAHGEAAADQPEGRLTQGCAHAAAGG